SASLAQISTAAEVLRSILIPLALILLVLDLLFAMLFSRWFTRPIERLSAGAKEIADGNYDVQISVVHRDEIGQLAEDFNHMASEVKRSAQLEKDILANVSHDLRTPLTLI
ncbi:HAMP domain-containing protein, partial [Gemmiger formicilis]